MAKKENTNKAIVEFLQNLVNDDVTIDWAKAQEVADKFQTKARSIVQICTRNNIPYAKKQRVSKTGKPVARKTELVAQIAKKYSLDVEQLDGLEKASKTSLEVLAGF